MYEYTTAVFAVGLDGFAPVDHDRLNAMAADGWEPVHMASAHNGLAAVVLLRRAGAGTATVTKMARARQAAPARKTAKTAKSVKSVKAVKTAKRATATRKAAAPAARTVKRSRGR